MKAHAFELSCYLVSWLYLSISPTGILETLFYGLLSGIGIASGRWLVEAFKRWKRDGGCISCAVKGWFK